MSLGIRPHGVVGRFAGDVDIVRVALAQARGGDAHELRGGAQRFNVGRAAVAHAGAETADHLIHRVGHRSAVRYAALDALGDELGVFLLEVAVDPTEPTLLPQPLA